MSDPATLRPASPADKHPQGTYDQGFFAELSDLGLIAFGGVDAAKFLHNQLTNDVLHLGSGEVRLAGYCTPKGRLLATMVLWHAGERIVAELAGELQATIQKRLQMFIMRDKVVVCDISADFTLIGLGGSGAATALAHWFPALPETTYTKCESAAGTLLRLADAWSQPRYQWIMPAAMAPQFRDELAAIMQQADIAYWRASEIAAAIPHITLATQEKFVPQMVNLEAVGGVSFKKGCYPGQEIVARSQYLGKLKRRMLPATVTASEVAPGMEVFSADDLEQPCGMVVNAARNPHDDSGLTHCLVEVKTAVVESTTVHLGPNGPLLNFSALPYALPDTV